MTAQLELLETMSPKEYQQIRLQLGNGSGQESPGFRVLLQMLPNIWRTFDAGVRSIGMGSASLKGRSVDLLQTGAKHGFFPQLWEIRSKMTDAWGDTCGRVRGTLTPENRLREPAHELEPVSSDDR